MQPLFHAHSGLRYLVLLAGVLAVVYLAWSVLTGRPGGRGSRIVTAAFTGLLDLQVVLGLILAATGIFYPALSGHIVTMLLAVAAAHVGSAMGRRAEGARADRIRLIGVGVALLLVVAGIAAIGRSVLGTGTPSMGG